MAKKLEVNVGNIQMVFKRAGVDVTRVDIKGTKVAFTLSDGTTGVIQFPKGELPHHKVATKAVKQVIGAARRSDRSPS